MSEQCYPTPEDLQNMAKDRDTFAEFVNGEEGDTNVNRAGTDVGNLETLRRDALAIASDAANLKTYVTKSAMDADTSQPPGTPADVMTGTGAGRYVWTGSAWVLAARQPADDQDVRVLQSEVMILDRDTSNIFSDAAMLDASIYSGDVAGLVPTTAAVPNKNLIQTISTTAEASIISPPFPVESNAAYFMGGRIGNQENSGSTGELYVDWYSGPDGSGSLISSTLIGTRTSNVYVNRSANVIAPETARSAKLRAVKSASTAATRGGFSFPVVRRAIDDVRMLRPDFLPTYTLAPQRFVDSPFYLTDNIASGVPADRPVFTAFTPYTGSATSSGRLAQVTPLSGVIARRETFSTWKATNDRDYKYAIKYVYGNRSSSAGTISTLQLGIAWYDATGTFLSETVVANQPNIGGGMRAFNTSVGTTASGADYPSPTDARYFSPFIRWVQTATILLIGDITVSSAQEGGASAPSRLHLRRTSTANPLSFYLPGTGTNRTEITLGNDVDATTDCYRIRLAYENRLDLSRVRQICHVGEWECAIGVIGASDAVGGYHGNERRSETQLFIDGHYFDPDEWTGDVDAEKVEFLQLSEIYLENTDTVLAHHLKRYVWDAKGFNLIQRVQFELAVDISSCQMGMLPIRRNLNGATGPLITDKARRITDLDSGGESGGLDPFQIEDYSDYTTGETIYTNNTTGVDIWGTTSGISASMRRSKDSTWLPTSRVYIRTGPTWAQYNKIYFNAGYFTTTTVGQVFDSDMRFEINTSNSD